MNECLSCGKPVKNKYCNVSCQNKHQRRKFTKEQCQKRHNTRFGEYKSFTVTCDKCNKEFEVVEREKLHPQKEKYHCSRSCANSREHTEESKLKTSNTIKKLIKEGNDIGFVKKFTESKIYEITCPQCNNIFKTKNKTQKFCSLSCSGKYNKWNNHDKVNWSEVNKKSYQNGHNYVAGGTSKWHDYKNIRVQGTYELRACYILDRWKETSKIRDWEYTKDRIQYIGIDNKIHSYILDFKIFENDNTFYYLETKGYIRENDVQKWKTTKEKGFKLEIWFEEDIIKNEK